MQSLQVLSPPNALQANTPNLCDHTTLAARVFHVLWGHATIFYIFVALCKL